MFKAFIPFRITTTHPSLQKRKTQVLVLALKTTGSKICIHLQIRLWNRFIYPVLQAKYHFATFLPKTGLFTPNRVKKRPKWLKNLRRRNTKTTDNCLRLQKSTPECLNPEKGLRRVWAGLGVWFFKKKKLKTFRNPS